MKAAFRHILLAALLLRAFVPMGWMPGTAQLGQAAFIICAADGSIQHGAPGKDEARPHQPCAFGSQLFDTLDVAVLALPSSAARPIADLVAQSTLVAFTAYTPQAPRAPPSFA